MPGEVSVPYREKCLFGYYKIRNYGFAKNFNRINFLFVLESYVMCEK